MQVTLERLDDVVQESVSVMKLDVEGSEASVLRGAARLLSRRALRHIIFEEHDVEKSETVAILRDAGYQLFAIGWRTTGLDVKSIAEGRLSKTYEAPSFVATSAPDDLIARTRSNGWRVLSRRFSRPRLAEE